jgi:uncharacterized protein
MSMTRRTAIRGLLAAAVGTTTGAVASGSLYQRHRIALARATVPVASLPSSLAGLRIGMLTDLHHGPFLPREELNRAVAMLLAERPDLIVLGGDYVTWQDRRFVGSCAEGLASLTAPHGVFAVLGNHDDAEDMPKALRARGFGVLNDARTRVAIGDEALEIAGLDFWTKNPRAIASLLRGARGTIVLIAHDPRRVAEAAALSVPLVLSGHTHGGQIVLPGLGAIAARKFPTPAGLFYRQRTALFVSRGVGTVVIPCRLNCPPEVAVLTLEAREQTEAAARG